MRREVRPEILDELPADDPRAIHSRRDLQKVNGFMRHVGMVVRTLRSVNAPLRLLVELGSGDGTFLLKVARRLESHTPVRAVLVDRRPSLDASTREGFKAAGWDVDACSSDVFDWLRRPCGEIADVMIANLFLHHFRENELATLLSLAATQTRRFIACEPRRSRTGLAGSSLMPLIGCNDVTIHDADISVRAGFRNRELSALWPVDDGWHLTEGRRGLFTHAFVAVKDETSKSVARP